MNDRPEQVLRGHSIVVCRPATQADTLISTLTRLGATVIHLPLIEVVSPIDAEPLVAAVDRLSTFDWVVFTSANAVDAVAGARSGATESWPERTRIAVVGATTARAVEAAGWPVEFVSPEATGQTLGRTLPLDEAAAGHVNVLLPLAELAGPDLANELAVRGADVESVTAYRTITPELLPARIAEASSADAVLLTSGSTVDRLVALLGRRSVPTIAIAIGPSTALAAERHGIEVAAIADPHDLDGLIAATLRTLAP